VKRLGEVPSFVPLSEAFPDLSGTIAEGFKLPRMPTTACLSSDQGLPTYFGKGLDDDVSEGFQTLSEIVPKALTDAFKTSGAEKAGSAGEGSDTLPAPNLVDAWKPITPAKTTTAFFKSLPTALGKKESPSKETDSPSEAEPAVPKVASNVAPTQLAELATRDALLSRINELSKRLEDLERKEAPRNTQKELLMFVGVGLFLIFSFDVAVRSAR
jgi:hypothetical protein